MAGGSPVIEVLAEIPPLAWLVDLFPRRRVLIGRGVDVRELPGRTEVSEGCWEGDFATSGIAGATHLFGSGFVVEGDGILFCGAAHTLEALYVYRSGERRIVSNSFAFLVSYSGVDLDPAVRVYPRALTVVKGLGACVPLIYSRGGEEILRYPHCSFRFGAAGIETVEKPLPPRFRDYRGYRDYLEAVLCAVRDNAAAPGRKRRYRLLTSISSGYDSGAVAVVAAAAGCDTAVTLRSGKDGRDDSGRPVAEALGLRCVERDRRVEGTADDPFPEVDFIVGFDPGDTVVSAFSDILPGSLYLTGYHGDALWDPGVPADDDIRRKDPSGMGLHEFRLRKDFVNVPLVFVGARRHGDVRAISLSEEMLPFRVGGSYDRPIPRRLLEEAGVPRALFGQSKRAVNVNLFFGERRMSEASRRDMRAFVARLAGPVRLAWEGVFVAVQHVADVGLGRVDGDFSRAVAARPPLRNLARKIDRHLRRRWDLETRYYFSCVLIWALTRAGERYASASAASRIPGDEARREGLSAG